MKIEFTNNEYELLIEMLNIATWVIAAHEIEPRPESAPYKELEQRIFSFAKELGCEDKIVYDEDLKKFFPTIYFEFDSPHREFIEAYDEETGWEELTEMLCYRDIDREIGLEAYDKLSGEERIKIFMRHENRWADEFENHGLERLAIIDEFRNRFASAARIRPTGGGGRTEGH